MLENLVLFCCIQHGSIFFEQKPSKTVYFSIFLNNKFHTLIKKSFDVYLKPAGDELGWNAGNEFDRWLGNFADSTVDIA